MLDELAVFLYLGLSLGGRFLAGLDGSVLSGQSEGVKFDHGSGVHQGVSLARAESIGGIGGSGSTLNFVGSHDSTDVGAGDNSSGDTEPRFERGVDLAGTEEVIELLEGRLSPDDKTTNVTTRGELEKVKAG